MKRIFALLLVGTLACGTMACGKTQPDTPIETTVSLIPQSADLPDDMQSMVEPIDALIRAMLEHNLDYHSQNALSVWFPLFYFASAYGTSHPLVYTNEETYQVIVPSSIMEEFATTLFADFKKLPVLPEDLEGFVAYDANADTYNLTMGDIGLSKTILTSCEKTETGYAISAQLWSIGPEEELICAYDLTLIKNTHLTDASSLLYHYSIQNLSPANV